MNDLRQAASAAFDILRGQLTAADDDCGDPACSDCNALRRPLQRVVDALERALAAPQPEPVVTDAMVEAAFARYVRARYGDSAGDAVDQDLAVARVDAVELGYMRAALEAAMGVRK